MFNFNHLSDSLYFIYFLKALSFLFLKILFIYFQAEGKVGRKRGRERSMCGCFLLLACNPGMCPDWESNQQPFASQASTQSTEPHQPGLYVLNFINRCHHIAYNFCSSLFLTFLSGLSRLIREVLNYFYFCINALNK